MIDRLIKAIEDKGNPTVVGLDPTLAILPEYLKHEAFLEYGKTPRAVGEAFVRFNKGIINAVCDIVPAVKPQIAMYEQYGTEGIDAYMRTVTYAKEKGLIVIGDIKRGDISSTAAAYASHIEGVEIAGEFFDPWKEDAVTINPYMGYDGISPFIKACNERDKGLFILVKTSNPSGVDMQDLVVEDGMSVYRHAGALVEKWGSEAMGEMGYSRIGAVVGATYAEQGSELRREMPHTFFLVPGYGAQGATADDLKGFFDANGRGTIVNSSRGIIAAYKKTAEFEVNEYALASREAALVMREDLRRVL